MTVRRARALAVARPALGALAGVALAVAAAGCSAAVAPAAARGPGADRAGAAATLRIMTFNIRYGSAADGPDAWTARRELAIGVVRSFAPAILSLQEALRFQLDELERAFPYYGEIGVGRDDGAQGGEYAAILYDRRRLTATGQGAFWLSDTPEMPGSMTWGNRFPRIVTWARLLDGQTGVTFYVFNTHWDHESQPARERGAALMLARMAALTAPGAPIVVTGDFNAGEDNAAFRMLLTTGAAPGVRLADTFRLVHPGETEVGTYHAFRGGRDGAKIDAVLTSPEWRVLEAGIVRAADMGRYPSDHFPVTATIALDARP